jgi:uncharacterized membrane protein YqhA
VDHLWISNSLTNLDEGCSNTLHSFKYEPVFQNGKVTRLGQPSQFLEVYVLSRILASSRYLILIAVLGSFGAFITLLLAGALQIVLTIVQTVTQLDPTSKGLKALSLSFIEIIDVFLLATVFYIVALGLYELFIDTDIQLPAWLSIQDLDDLKNKLASVVIVVLGVLFLGKALEQKSTDILPYGAAVALVIAALTYFLSQKVKKSKPE